MRDLPEDVTLDTLVEHLWRHRSADPGDDVADPYRRGPEAMSRAAKQIDANLEVIVGGLARLANAPR